MMNLSFETTPEELFQLIGEREFIKFRQGQLIEKLYAQIEEMSNEITRLKGESDGKLEQPFNQHSV